MYHRSVLLGESIEALAIRPAGIYVDATYGGGGHSKEILNKLHEGRLLVFDQDAAAMGNKLEDTRLTMIHNNFRYLKNFLRLFNVIPVDGILADLGVSSFQIDEPGRGFSTRFNGSLDMRMDLRKKITAGEVIASYTEEKLKEIFLRFGEIRNASRVASLLVSSRKHNAISTTRELVTLLKSLAPRGQENQFLAQVFQALRIEVNQELEALKEFLVQCAEVLKPGGRLVVISYHSLEDKLVKNYMRAGNWAGEIEKDFYGNPLIPFTPVYRKPVVPGAEEVRANPRARSARLRVALKS